MISQEEEWSGQMKSVHKRLKVPMDVEWGFHLSQWSHPCTLRGPSELHVANWSFSTKLTQCPLFWAIVSSVSDHWLLIRLDLPLDSGPPPAVAGSASSFLSGQWRSVFHPYSRKAVGRGCRESFAWTHLIPQPERGSKESKLRPHWMKQAHNSTGNAHSSWP